MGEVAIGDDAADIWFDDSRDNADRLLLLINAFYKDFTDFAGAKNFNRIKIQAQEFDIERIASSQEGFGPDAPAGTRFELR